MNNKGVSIIFVIGALLVVGFIGISLINMSHSDQISAVLYSSSESARTAAHSGIVVAMAEFNTADSAKRELVLERLNAYASAKNPDTLNDSIVWISGGSNSWDTLSSTQKYRVKINGFQPETFEISLLADGIGMGNSKASVVGTYDLVGLVWETVSSGGTGGSPTHALQMDNGAFEFDVPLIVWGNTALKKGMHLWDPAEFHGTLRCDTLTLPDGTQEIADIQFSSGELKVYDNAYFAGKIGGGGANATFYKSAAFSDTFYFQNSNVNFDATGGSKYIFAGGTDDAGTGNAFDMQNNYIEVHNNTETYDPNNDITSFTNFNNSWPSITGTTPANIMTKVGFDTTIPPKIYFDTTKLGTPHHIIDASPIYSKNKITATDLNNIYNSATNLLAGKFAVVKVIGNNTANGIFENDGSIFTGKMILWVNNGRNIVGDYVETTTGANLTVYVGDGLTTTPHFNNFNYARGYIYLNSYGVNNFAFGGSGGSCEIEGGIYAGSTVQLFFHGSGVQTIRYNYDAIYELSQTGVFTPPDSITGVNTGNGSSGTNIVLDSNATQITPEILGTAM